MANKFFQIKTPASESGLPVKGIEEEE